MNSETSNRVSLVLFGGTGDLATRKLLPALFRLWEEGKLVDCSILGVGRRCQSTEKYRQHLQERVASATQQPQKWAEFCRHIEFHQGDLASAEDFRVLSEKLRTIEAERNLPGNRLFYYSVGPSWFVPITDNLVEAGLLSRQSSDGGPWTRLVLEKPFGYDLASARQLDGQLHAVAEESQIFRIDHYLGKETVQNLLAFRFANGLFEPIWNRKYVESVQITVAESIGVGSRAAYYEKAGALRDMVQNHMLQLLSLTAMEPPIGLAPDEIRDEKLKAIRSIRIPNSAQEVYASTVRGQYGPGTEDGQTVPGYRQEPGIDPHSTTPTYLAARLYLDSWRWANVPFFLRHGKRLAKRGTEIAIKFHTPPLALFRDTDIFGHCINLLVLRIQPNEGISLHFGAKRPGAGMRISNVRMDFEYEENFHCKIPDAYERLLLDALLGDPTLFMRSDEVEAMWRWADALLNGWQELPRPKFPNYSAGSWGPAASESLFPHGDEISLGSCPVGWRRW